MTQIQIHNDEDGMRAALAWSARGRGWTSPRPSVGSVLVQNGVVIGGGHTQHGDGNPHAEVMALRAAKANGSSTRGATAYVTLEPCSHFGTTPPCSLALIEAGIARVVFGVLDPNPEIDGRGVRHLQSAGVEIRGEFMRQECVRAQDHFLKNITTNLPFVTLKSAVSLDGKIATQTGDSQWISNAQSRERAHQMRHDHDAVLIGIDTLLADDAQLNVRLEGNWKQPKRIVVDSRGRFPMNAKMLHDDGQKIIVATTEKMTHEKRAELENFGVRVLVLPQETSQINESRDENASRENVQIENNHTKNVLDETVDFANNRAENSSRENVQIENSRVENGRVDLSSLWRALPDERVFSVLIEGGAQISAAALRSGNVDKVAFFVAPLLIGGDGISVLPSLETRDLSQALRLRDVQTENLGGDVLIQGYTRDIV